MENEWTKTTEELQALMNEAIKTLQRAYRKHHLDDPGIGWGEMNNELKDTLCNLMGDKAFLVWLDRAGRKRFVSRPEGARARRD